MPNQSKEMERYFEVNHQSVRDSNLEIKTNDEKLVAIDLK